MLLLSRPSSVRFVNPDNTEMSEMLLPERLSSVRLVANSSPAKLLMLAFGAARRVNSDMSDTVIDGSPCSAQSLLNCRTEIRVGDIYCLRCCRQRN